MSNRKMREALRAIPGFGNALDQVSRDMVNDNVLACITSEVTERIETEGPETMPTFSNDVIYTSEELGGVELLSEEYDDFLVNLDNFELEVEKVSELMHPFNDYVVSVTDKFEVSRQTLSDLLVETFDNKDLSALKTDVVKIVKNSLSEFSNTELSAILEFIKEGSLYEKYIEAINEMVQACPTELIEIIGTDMEPKIIPENVSSEDYLQIVLPYIFWGVLTEGLNNNSDVFITVKDSFEETYGEPYEYWLVDDWFADKLSDRGEMINKDDFTGTVWGRQCTGQAIYMDPCIQDIALEYSLTGHCYDTLQRVYSIKRNQKAAEALGRTLTFEKDTSVESLSENYYRIITAYSSVSEKHYKTQQYALFNSFASTLIALNVTDFELVGKIREGSKDLEEEQCLVHLHNSLTYTERGNIVKVLLTISEKQLNVTEDLKEFLIERLGKLMNLLANVSKNKYVSEFDTSKLVYHETLDRIKEYKQILSICKEYNMGTDFISEEFFEDLEKE